MAATDPEHADDEAGALRERLARSGLAFGLSSLPDVPAPTESELQRARAAAGHGVPLSELVSEGRR